MAGRKLVKPTGRLLQRIAVAAFVATLLAAFVVWPAIRPDLSVAVAPEIIAPDPVPPILRLVSYAYTERTPHDVRNLEFFLRHGVYRSPDTVFYVVVNGDRCAPCQGLSPEVIPPERILYRDNFGYDFGAHGHLLSRLEENGTLSQFHYLFFINSSARGPFVPKFMRRRRWTDAFEALLVGKVGGAGTALVCLPQLETIESGPRIEGYAYALTRDAVRIARNAGVFHPVGDKYAVVVNGEYGLSAALIKAGLEVDTLMSKYYKPFGAEPAIPNCNRNAHPSRHNAVDGIDLHPYEVLFVKTQWQQSYLHTLIYSDWMDRPDAEDAQASSLHEHFMAEENVHPPRALVECPQRIGTKKLVVANWRRPQSPAERNNIGHFLKHVHASDQVDFVFNVYDADVVHMIKRAGVDALPNVQVQLHPREMLSELCMHGWTALRLNQRALQYSTFFFLNEGVRGPLGSHNSGLQWIDRYAAAMHFHRVSIMTPYMIFRAGELRAHLNLFAVDHVGLNVLLWLSSCHSHGSAQGGPFEVILPADALGRRITIGSMQRGAIRLTVVDDLKRSEVLAAFAIPPTELGEHDLHRMAFMQYRADGILARQQLPALQALIDQESVIAA